MVSVLFFVCYGRVERTTHFYGLPFLPWSQKTYFTERQLLMFVSVTASFILPPSQDGFYYQVGALVFQTIAKTCVTKASKMSGGRRLFQADNSSMIDFTDATVLAAMVQVSYLPFVLSDLLRDKKIKSTPTIHNS